MSRYPLGQPVRISTTVRDVTGALVNPSTLTLLVKTAQADGTQLTTGTYASPVNDSTGAYHQDVPATDLTAIGHYQYTWTATGTGAGVSFGDFDVFDPFEAAVLPLQDGKDALNIPQSTTTSDTEIQQYIATIQSNMERMTGGPLTNRSITERAELTDAYTVLQVRQRPLVSVTSIMSVASGQALDISAGLDIDTNAGTIRRKLGYPFYGPYFVWLPAMLVTYVAGWGTAVPAAFNTAARIILQNLWETQHGPSARPSMGANTDMVTLPGWGFAIPNQAAELLDGSQNGMPFMLEAYV
ncbi:MAG TPA: hypothetical protein VF482_14545 [Trebonia sp.]